MDAGFEGEQQEATGSGDGSSDIHTAPLLPYSEPKPPPPMAPTRATSSMPSGTWYRSDQDRYRSVYRRANPWYRRLLRGLIAVTLLTALGVGVYVGASELRDWLDRDKLPAAGDDVTPIAASSFLITSRSPSPAVEGTLRLNVASGAFDFVGTAGTSPLTTEVVSPDGSTVFVREGRGEWRAAGAQDAAATAVRGVVPYLMHVVTADHVLTNRLRKGYIDLIDKSQVGLGDDAYDRYDMAFNTSAFASDYPLQWQEFAGQVVPGIVASSSAPVSITLDQRSVVMSLDVTQSNFEWQRLSYDAVAYTDLLDPSGVVPAPTVAPTPTTVPAG